MKKCTTHSFACDCRERRFLKLESDNTSLKDQLDRYKKALDLALYYIEGDATWGGVTAKVKEIL